MHTQQQVLQRHAKKKKKKGQKPAKDKLLEYSKTATISCNTKQHYITSKQATNLIIHCNCILWSKWFSFAKWLFFNVAAPLLTSCLRWSRAGSAITGLLQRRYSCLNLALLLPTHSELEVLLVDEAAWEFFLRMFSIVCWIGFPGWKQWV